MDIKGSKEAGLLYEGHTDRIRTMAKITKKVKAYSIKPGKKKKPIIKDSHYIITHLLNIFNKKLCDINKITYNLFVYLRYFINKNSLFYKVRQCEYKKNK